MAAPAVTDRKDAITQNPPERPKSETPSGVGEADADFLATARTRFERAASAEAWNRKEAVEDLLFKNGQQWPEDIKAERTIQKRPCLTINKMKTFVHQVTNNQRQNRPSIMVSPVGDGSDKNTAQMLRGLIRQIERQSDADIAYDTALDSAVSNGWGYWRILTEYEDDASFDQAIKIVRIRNPFRVYIDPDSQMPDGSDARWCFISDLIPRSEFEAMYPDADPVAWIEGALGDETMKDWSTLDHVRIAEYFYFENKKRKLLHLIDGSTAFEDELAPEVRETLKMNPDMIRAEREVQGKQAKWCKMTAREVLERNDWVGKWIPIVKVIGDEVDVEGKVTYSGVIRDAKDPQRMKNYWATAKTELIALAPKAPYIMEEGQVEGHETRWQQANIKSYPYLLYKGTNIAGKQAPAPRREPFAGPPTGVIEAEQSAEQDMMGTTGVRFDATKSEKIPDESGRALRELKILGEMGSFHYIDNLARSLKHTARILIDLIPKIYDTPRVLTILREDDSEERVRIEPNLQVPYQTRPGMGGGVEKLYNPSLGKYDVAVSVGPSFQTKRQEAAESMLQFMRFVPQSAPVIGDLIAKNMDWPGAEQIAARLASMLPPQLAQMEDTDLPPEARAMIGSLKMQLAQAGQQLQQAMGALQEKGSEYALQNEKIQKDYEAKVAQVNERWQEAVMKLRMEESASQRDYDAKMTKIVADLKVDMMGFMQDNLNRIADQINVAQERLESAAKESAERETREPRQEAPRMPDVHIHMPSGKKKITGPGGKTFISEDVDE